MKFKGLAVLGILLAALSCSGVVSHAAERISGEELPLEVNYTYETAPWIRDDGSVDDELAHYYRIANAEKGGREVNQFYYGAKDGIKVYRTKDKNSEVVAEYDLNDFIYIHIVYDDGWAWSGFEQGYVKTSDLSEDWIRDEKGEDIMSANGEDDVTDNNEDDVEITVNGLKIIISQKKD